MPLDWVFKMDKGEIEKIRTTNGLIPSPQAIIISV